MLRGAVMLHPGKEGQLPAAKVNCVIQSLLPVLMGSSERASCREVLHERWTRQHTNGSITVSLNIDCPVTMVQRSTSPGTFAPGTVINMPIS